MRHPALTRFFAAMLAVMCLITLISGALCLKKAGDVQQRQAAELDLLKEKTQKAKELGAILDEGREKYDSGAEEYDSLSRSYSADMTQYRMDLAMLTATEAGVKQGRAQLRTGLGAFYTAKAEYENGLELFNEAEAQFNEGYEQYLAGKEALEQGWQQYYAAEKYLAESGIDVKATRAGIQQGARTSRELSGEISALLDVLSALPADPESGEQSADELQALISQRIEAVLGGLAESGQIDLAALDAASAAEAMENIEALSGLLELAGASDGSEEELRSKLEALRADAEALASGELDDTEQLATAISMLRTEKELCDYAAEKLTEADAMLAVLEDLPALRAQLEEAQKAFDESAPMMEETKKQMESGREQLDAAGEAMKAVEQQLYNARVALDEKEAELASTREELEQRKLTLEETSAHLEELDAEVGDYVRTRDAYNDIKYYLLADDGIAERFDAALGLTEAADTEIAARRESSAAEHGSRVLNAALMLACALAGTLSVIFAFRDRRSAPLLASSSAAVLLSVAALALSVSAGRGLIYTAPFVGLFALGVLLLNLKKA